MKQPRVTLADVRAHEARNQFSVVDFARHLAERRPGVVGAGYRLAREQDGARPGLVLDVLLERRDDGKQRALPEFVGGLPVVSSVVGSVRALARTDRLARPVRGGAAIGTAPNGSTGTLACRAFRDVGGKRQYYLLSCAHVLNSDNAPGNNLVVQPSVPYAAIYDDNVVGDLERVVNIDFNGATNVVDAAIARARTGAVKAGVMGVGSVKSWMRANDVSIGLEVLRSGINSPVVNRGVVTRLAVALEVKVGGQLAWFANTIVTTDIAFSGDSGSLVLTEADHAAVGLVMAAAEEEGSTIVCPIEAVQDALDVRVSDKVWPA